MHLRSPFYEIQKACGAVFKIYDFLSYELPSFFSSAEEEYAALSQSCVVIDFSFYGRLRITGKHALDFMNRMSTNDLKKLNENQCAATVLTNDKGRIVDLIMVNRQEDGLHVMTSPLNDEKIIQWLDKYIIMDDVHIENLSACTIYLGLIGPGSVEILSSLLGTDPPEQGRIVHFILDGHPMVASRSNHLGNGYTITAADTAKQVLWNFVDSHKIMPCGMDAYFSMRIEQKKPIKENELSEKYNPLEAGLQSAVSFTKGCYIGQEVIARLDSYNKIQKHLVQLKCQEPIPDGSKILSESKEIGIITSSTHSYKYGQFMALGYVKTEFINAKSILICTTSQKLVQAEICS